MADCFHRAVPEDELSEGKTCAVALNGWFILLTRYEDAVSAVVNTCTHANALLSDGRFRRGTILCPLHGARFDVRSGACTGGGYLPLKTFKTRASGGWIEIELPEEPPGAQFMPVNPRA